jgi:hypothetical protein
LRNAALAFFFGFWELKRQLTDGVPKSFESVSDSGVLSDLSERMKREQFLGRLPHHMLSKLRMLVGLKFLFVAIFIIEVILLQSSL